MLVLTGAALIDGTGAAPVRGRAVAIEDGRIVFRSLAGSSYRAGAFRR